jgi:hypothetical protein
LVTVIEGESLVNDATALVAYRFALTAIATGSFSLSGAALQFVWVAVGGAGVGLLVALFGIFIVEQLKDSSAETTLTLVTSFAAYILAEQVRAFRSNFDRSRRSLLRTKDPNGVIGRNADHCGSFLEHGAIRHQWSRVHADRSANACRDSWTPRLLLGATHILWRNCRARCDRRSIHLGVPCNLPAEEIVSFYCS